MAVGVDTSAAMLAHVGELPSGWVARDGDARSLPFGDGAFDVAVASYVLHVLPHADLPATLAELARVVRPDGRLVTVTPALPARGAARWLASLSDALAQRYPLRFGGLRALDPRSALVETGFRLVRARTNLNGYPSLCVLARMPAA